MRPFCPSHKAIWWSSQRNSNEIFQEWLLCCCDNMLWQRHLKGERTYLYLQFKNTVYHGCAVKASHCLLTVRHQTEMNACWCSAHKPFQRGTSNSLMEIILHRHSLLEKKKCPWVISEKGFSFVLHSIYCLKVVCSFTHHSLSSWKTEILQNKLSILSTETANVQSSVAFLHLKSYPWNILLQLDDRDQICFSI